MAFEVMHADRGHAQRERQRIGDACAHQQCARESRSLRVGNTVEIGKDVTRLRQHRFGQRHDAANMVSRRKFRHHSAVGIVHRDLRMQRVREQAARAVVQREARFVAGRFDTEDEHELPGEWRWQQRPSIAPALIAG